MTDIAEHHSIHTAKVSAGTSGEFAIGFIWLALYLVALGTTLFGFF